MCNFTKINTPPWVFFTFFKLQMVKNRANHNVCNANQLTGFHIMETLAWKWQKHQDDIIEVLKLFLLTLIHFTSMFYFYTPWKHLNTIGLLMFLWGVELERCVKWVSPFESIIAFHIETSNSFCRAKQMTGFYMKRKHGLKWVKQVVPFGLFSFNSAI